MGVDDPTSEVAAAQLYIGLVFSLLGIAVIAFMYLYADRGLFYWHSYLSIALAYFSAIGILLVLPMDMTLTRLRREAPTEKLYEAYTSYGDVMIDLYKSLYWPMMASGNLILIVLEEYNESGYFSFAGRSLDALMQLGKQACVATAAGLVFIILLVLEAHADSMSVISMTVVALSNTYGLFAIAFLLGFGLMELPKQTWMAGSLVGRVKRVQAKAAHEYRRMDDASLDVSEIVGSINLTKSAIHRKDKQLLECAEELMADLPEGIRGAGGEAKMNKVTGQVTVHELASLRRTLHYKLRTYFCARAKIESLKEECFFLEDVLTAFLKGEGYIVWISGEETGTLRYLWEAWWRPLGMRVLGVAWLGLSVLIMLGELGLFAGANSPIASLTEASRETDLGNGSFTVVIMCALGFLVYVLIFALFQLRLTNTMEIVPGKKTNRASLSFNARLFCTFAAPLAYNFLGLTLEAGPTIQHARWMDSVATGKPVETSFSTFYGKLNVVPLVGDNIDLIIPIFIIIVAALHCFNLLNRTLQFLRLGALQFGDIPISKEELQIGEAKLKRAREMAQRAANRDQRMKSLKRGVLNIRIRLPKNPAGVGMMFYDLCRRKRGPTSPHEEPRSTDHLSVEIPDSVDVVKTEESPNSTPGLSPVGSPSAELRALDGILPRDPKILEKYAAMKLMRVLNKPEPRRGYAEKKAHKAIGGVVGRGWQKRFFLIQDPGRLCYYEHEEDVELVDDAKWEVDIKDLGEPTLHTTANGTVLGTRLDIPLPKEDDVLKMRFWTDEEAMDWLMALMSWQQWLQQSDNGGQQQKASVVPAATETLPPLSPVGSEAGSPKNQANSTMGGTLFSMLGWNATKNFSAASTTAKVEVVVEAPIEVPAVIPDGRPPALSGWLGKKSSKHTQTWNDRYFVVERDDPCLRYYYGPELGDAKGRFDLREAEKVEPYAKGSKKDPLRFVVVFKGRDNKLKLKAEKQAHADEWTAVLQDWITYYRNHPSEGPPSPRRPVDLLN